jgi:hypothetical protein
MQRKFILAGFVLLIITTPQLKAQYSNNYSAYKMYFAGSTCFRLGNLYSKNRPDFVQINIGYRITGRDVISLELRPGNMFDWLAFLIDDPLNHQAKNFPAKSGNMDLLLPTSDFYGEEFTPPFR